MKLYVDFICDQVINLDRKGYLGHYVKDGRNQHVKNIWIPIRVEIVERYTRSIKLRVSYNGISKEDILYMSRHFGPSDIAYKYTKKVDKMFSEILDENEIDREELFKTYDPFKDVKERGLFDVIKKMQ